VLSKAPIALLFGGTTYGNRPADETLADGFFPRRTQAVRLLAAASLQKSRRLGCSAALRPNRVHRRCAPHHGLAIAGDRPLRQQRRKTMTAIGYVTKNDNGSYKGQLRTVSIRADIDIVPNRDKSAETHPDFRVMTQGVEIGAGWIRRGENSGKDYVSLSLAAPEFGPRKLYANLGRAAGQDDDSVFAVIWNPAD
jgi:uncharacterized protein (DUF736 family)